MGDATPPQYTNGADEVIEKGSSIRVKITGLRSDVGAMFAIGSINDDYYGFVFDRLAMAPELTFSKRASGVRGNGLVHLRYPAHLLTGAPPWPHHPGQKLAAWQAFQLMCGCR